MRGRRGGAGNLVASHSKTFAIPHDPPSLSFTSSFPSALLLPKLFVLNFVVKPQKNLFPCYGGHLWVKKFLPPRLIDKILSLVARR